MLTNQEIIELFKNKVGEIPDEQQIEEYNNYSFDELTVILDRRIAIERDPTYFQRLAENYQLYLEASLEEKAQWKFPDPTPLL